MKLLSLFSDERYSRLLDWIYKFSRNTKVVYRVFALDIVAELLNQPLRCPKEGIYFWNLLILYSRYDSPVYTLKISLSRISIALPCSECQNWTSVKGRAHTCFADALAKHVKGSSVIPCCEHDKAIQTHGRMIFGFYRGLPKILLYITM